MKTKKIIYILAAILSVLVLFFSCASAGPIAQVASSFGLLAPETADAIAKSGVAWQNAFEEITPEQEYYIGRAVAANVLSTYRLQTGNQEMIDYVNKICQAIIINSPRPEIFSSYHVNILDSDEINAFATPGGHIFITRGLINCATSEDTLAAVIAHEVAHIQLQHGLKAIKNSRITNALMVTGASTASAALGSNQLSEMTSVFSESVKEIVTSMVNNGYSQTQEFDADSTAMVFLSLAGYEPSALLDMLNVLDREQGRRSGGFNRTHPTPAQRITNAQKTVGNYSVEDTRSYRTARFSNVR